MLELGHLLSLVKFHWEKVLKYMGHLTILMNWLTSPTCIINMRHSVPPPHSPQAMTAWSRGRGGSESVDLSLKVRLFDTVANGP